MTYTEPTQQEFLEHRQRLEAMAKEQGRAVISVPKEDENGEVITGKDGNPIADVTYTFGNWQTKHPELVTFYPGARTAHAVLNKLSKALEEGRLPYPRNHKEAVIAEDFIPGTGTHIIYYALNAEQRAIANEEWTCQHWDDEENVPFICVTIPAPDGKNYFPVTPQALMADETYQVVSAEYDDAKWVAPKVFNHFRLRFEPGTDDWGKANIQMILTFLNDWVTDTLLLGAIQAKREGKPRWNLRCEDAVDWAMEAMAELDPTTKDLAEGVLAMHKQTFVEGAIQNNQALQVVNGAIELMVEV